MNFLIRIRIPVLVYCLLLPKQLKLENYSKLIKGDLMSGMTSLVQAAGVIEHKMETVANNLANVNTVGFKEDQPSFREVLSTVQRVVPESLEERFLSHEYLDDYVGMDKSAVIVDEVGKNFEPGRLRSTGNDLDLQLQMKVSSL